MSLVLVTGGVRSGKSRYAENLLDPGAPVLYVATGPERGDADWQARVQAHRARRPQTWGSRATSDAAGALREHDGPVLLDCLGTWLTACLDELDAWEQPRTAWADEFHARRDSLLAALGERTHPTVVVTSEVGLGLVSAYRSGRVFADELGVLNQRVAALAQTVVLTVSGLPLAVKGSLPPAPGAEPGHPA